MATCASPPAADPGTAYKLLLSCPAGLPRSRVSVKFHPSFDRIPHPDASLEESIEQIWNQRLQENPSLYSGTKFRYGGHATHHNDESNQEYCVSLHLGLTGYRTFVGTNLSPLWEKFLAPSEDDCVCCQHMSNPLGNGAIVETSDEKIIVLQRSTNVGESPGSYVFPGGHSEYGGHASHQNDESSQEYCVSLHLGLTDYRTFVGTNLSPLWEKFLVPSEDDSVCCQHMSNPLGNAAIVETSDEKIIVLQRSNNVGESPGSYVFPGGHSEPQEVGILAHQNDVEDVADLIERVSDEMFDGIIREVVEDTGVPASSLSEPIFIGVSRRETNVRPAAFFYVRCNVDSSTVTELYSRAQDGFESTKLYTVSTEELREMSQRLPGCHQGGFALYELMRNAAGNS